MHYIEVSAKTGHNVEKAFYQMAYEVHGQNSPANVSRDKGARTGGDSTVSDRDNNVMQDRVKLRPNGKTNQYEAANEAPSGMI